jgi:hypothetical protein
MSGQQILLAVGSPSALASITVGTGGATYGYNSGNFGSFTGSLTLPGNGGLFSFAVVESTTGLDFEVVTSTAWSTNSGTQFNGFTSILVQDDTGTIRTYTAASATYTTPGNLGAWAWGTGSSPVWTNTVTNPRSFAMS